MTIERKLLVPAYILCMFLFISKNASSQFIGRYSIKLKLHGVQDGTSVFLINNNGVQIEGKFRGDTCNLVQISDSLCGTPAYVRLEKFSDLLQVMTDRNSEIRIVGDFADWPRVSVSGPTIQKEYNDFQSRIQQPFSTEYKVYANLMGKVTRSKKKWEWEGKIKHLTGRDSLDVFIATQQYQNAILLYQKQTLEWIFLNPQSYFAPELIMRWCPRAAWKNAYRILTTAAKGSYYGTKLKAAME